LVLPVFAVVIILMRFHTYDEPIQCDITLYSSYAHELLNGRCLYSDLWEQKPPAVFLTWAFGEWLTGYGKGCIFFLNVLASIVTLLGIYRAGTLLSGQKNTGLFAAFLWVIISGDLGLEANQPNMEVFINAVIIWMFNLWLLETYKKWNLGLTLAIGSLAALVSLYKQYFIVMAFFLALAHLVSAKKKTESQTAFLQIGVIGAVVCFWWAVTLLYFTVTGRFTIFYKTVVGFCLYYANSANYQYSTSMFVNLIRGLSPENVLPANASFLLPLFILSLTGLGVNLGKRQRPWFLFLALIPSVYIVIALPGKFWPHYYQIWFPVLSVGAAWSLEWIYQKKSFVFASVLGVLSVGIVGAHEWKWYPLTPLQCSEVKYGDYYAYQDAGSKVINLLLLPTETFYEWDAYPMFYASAGRGLSVGNLSGVTLFTSPMSPELIQKVISDLEVRKPELVIMDRETAWSFDVRAVVRHPVTLYLSSHYIPFLSCGPNNRFSFCALKGGALEQRLQQRVK
jgi:hypothetical protein